MRRIRFGLLACALAGLSACEQAPESDPYITNPGGVGSGVDTDHDCSGLVKGNHCPSTIIAAFPDGGIQTGPNNFIPVSGTCNPANGVFCDGVAQVDGGITMPPVPPTPPAAPLYVANTSNGVVRKVNTATPGVIGTYVSNLPSCTNPAFTAGFVTSGGTAEVAIRKWRVGNGSYFLNPIYVNPQEERWAAGENASRNATACDQCSGVPGEYRLQPNNGSSRLYKRRPEDLLVRNGPNSYAQADLRVEFDFKIPAAGAPTFAFVLHNNGASALPSDPNRGEIEDFSLVFEPNFGSRGRIVLYFNGAVVKDWDLSNFNRTMRDGQWQTVKMEIASNGVRLSFSRNSWNLSSNSQNVVPISSLNFRNLIANSCGGFGTPYPSRTTIDGNGDAWVANRAFGAQASVTKIGGAPVAGKCWRDTNGNGFQVSETSTGSSLYGNGANDECVLFTVPVGGKTQGMPRAMALSGADLDSGPPGSVWVGLFSSPRSGYAGMANKLRNADGYEVAWFGLNINPYGAAVAPDGKVWYTTGHSGSSLQYVDNALYEKMLNGDPAGCTGQGCVSSVFSQPGSCSGNCTVKGGGYCNSQYYGVTVDEYSNVWNAGYSCGAMVRFTPPGKKRVDTGTFPDFATATLAGANGHWDYYGLGHGVVGVFVSKSNPAQGIRPKAFSGRETVTRLDGISMAYEAQFGTIGGHGGLGFDANGRLWRVGGSNTAGYNSTTGALYANVSVVNDTYTYSDFTGYIAQNITSRQATYAKVFGGDCGDNTRRRWMKLTVEGETPPKSSVQYFAFAVDDPAMLAAYQTVTTKAGPFWLTPDVPYPTTAPKNRDDSLVYLQAANLIPNGPLLPSFYLIVATVFQAEDLTKAPIVSKITVDGICAPEPVPACTPKSCAQLGKNCGQISDGCGNLLTCGSCVGGKVCGGTTSPNNVCGTGP